MAFDKETYVFHIGSSANLTCDVANIEDWTEIHVLNSANHVYFSRTKHNSSSVDNGVSSDQSEIQDTHARVILEFKDIPCGSLRDNFTCAVKTNTSWLNVTSAVIFESKYFGQ